MHQYADIAFPTAVRRTFTYHVPRDHHDRIVPGMRVWVPLRGRMAIGMAVRVHDEEPDFETRAVARVLDEQPVLSRELLQLTGWIHRFYYASWGEAIQAALPVGLNFYAEEILRRGSEPVPMGLGKMAREMLDAVEESDSLSLKEARRRWSETREANVLEQLLDRGLLEVWEEPSVKVKTRMEKVWHWTDEATSERIDELIETKTGENGSQPKWIEALVELRELGLPALQHELTEHELLEYYTLNRIREEKLIEMREVPAHKIPSKLEHDPSRLKTLNEEQQEAYDAIMEPVREHRFKSFLLYGVTGSGKTEVYIHALREVLDQGRGGLVLVPEIGLTPQTVRRFYQIFGDQIAVLHSRLSDRERYDAWRALRRGDKKIAIGARSAVFAPIQNLGLVIVDEEHDSSYKQEDPSPRYHARDVAIMRAYKNDGVVVMGSATPSLVALYGVRRGKHQLLRLTQRHARATMPEVKVLDLKQYRSAMKGPLAVPLYQAIEAAVGRNEQVILLYNRRGHSSFMQCDHCGQIAECPNCTVSLTYHKSKNTLRCHYCGYSKRADARCTSCHTDSVELKGAGTQKVEEELQPLFPDARLLRMDQDTTSGKDAHAEILNTFGSGEADILLGTQLVAKGLDFPNVTVVGVINADTELAFPAFNSSERMYQLLSQVAGRSGRAEKTGRVFLQTRLPDHVAIQCARYHDHEKFARAELASRKPLNYPPYARLIMVLFKGRHGHKVMEVAHAFTEAAREVAGNQAAVLGPSPAAIAKMKQNYRWECVIKVDPDSGAGAIESFVDRIFEAYEQQKPEKSGSVRINVDVDAVH